MVASDPQQLWLPRRRIGFISAVPTLGNQLVETKHLKNITAELEETLKKLVLWCRFRCLTQRDLSLEEATIDNLNAVSAWITQATPEGP